MRIAITGGRGLIGGFITPALLNAGHSVCLVSRQPRPSQGADTQWKTWDGKTPGAIVDTVEWADVIIHMIGENMGSRIWTPSRRRVLYSSRVEPGDALVKAIQQSSHKPGLLIQMSAIGWYGNSDEHLFIEGDRPTSNDFLTGIAAAWEDSTLPIESMGVRRLILRTALFLTGKGGILNRFTLPFKLFAGGPLGNGKQWYSWIHAADWVAALLFLLEKPDAAGVYNFSAPNPVRMAEFGKTLGAVMRRPYWMPVPAFALRIVLGEMSKLVLKGQRVYPQRLLDAGFHFQYPELKPALKAIFQSPE